MEDAGARRRSYAARFAARREQLPAAAQLRAAQPPADAAWLRLTHRGAAGEALADAAAAEVCAYGASKRQAVAVRGGHGGGRRWLLVPAPTTQDREPEQAGADPARPTPAHAEPVAARDTRAAGSVGLGNAHVRHFQNLSLCRELHNMQLQVREVPRVHCSGGHAVACWVRSRALTKAPCALVGSENWFRWHSTCPVWTERKRQKSRVHMSQPARIHLLRTLLCPVTQCPVAMRNRWTMPPNLFRAP